MVPASFLRIYRPLDSFDPAERARWTSYIEGGARAPLSSPYRHVAFDDPNHMGVLYPATAEHAFVRRVGGRWFVCPWRTKLRVLVGLLAFRSMWPYEIADAFVPEQEAAKAATELERLRSQESELRAYITTATWHVPLRWFIAFDDADRNVSEERGGIRVLYETDLKSATSRVERGLSILKGAGMAEAVIEPVADLLEWITQFPLDGLLELDYGTVAGLFLHEELVLDRSAGEVWSCIEALEIGDFDESGRIYGDLSIWWGRVRALQSAN